MSHLALATLVVLALSARAGTDPSATPATTGSVAGEIRMEKTPARRTAERYVGAVPANERSVQQVPTVVYLKGAPLREDLPRPRLRLMQKDTAFAPGALVVPVGTTVEFPNADPFFHNVFSYSKPKRFDLGRYPQGETKAVRFDAPGIVKVYCEVHRSMRALVVVVDTPHYAVVGADGRFAIPDVTPGRYELVVVDADRGTRTAAVTVAEGRTTSVTVTLP